MLTYTVRRAFPHEGVWYTRENAGDVKQLPRALRDELIEQGVIEEYDDHTKAPAPAAPATSADKKA